MQITLRGFITSKPATFCSPSREERGESNGLEERSDGEQKGREGRKEEKNVCRGGELSHLSGSIFMVT